MKIRLNLRTVTGTVMCFMGTVNVLIIPTSAPREVSVYGWAVFVIVTGATLLIFGEWFNEDHRDRRR